MAGKTRYQVMLDGELYDDYTFDTYSEAQEYAFELISASKQGAEILEMSNPGDYPLDDYEEPDYDIVEVDD